MELKSQLSGGFGGCRWPLMPALGTGRLQLSKKNVIALGRMRIRVRSRVRMYAGFAWDVQGCHAGCTRDLSETAREMRVDAREILFGISRNPPLC